MPSNKSFNDYYKEIFGITLGFFHKPKGNDQEKQLIRAYLEQAERNKDRTLGSHMLDMAYEINRKCGDEVFYQEVMDRYNNIEQIYR